MCIGLGGHASNDNRVGLELLRRHEKRSIEKGTGASKAAREAVGHGHCTSPTAYAVVTSSS